MSISLKADPSGTFGEILVNGQVVAKLPAIGNAVIPNLVGTVSQSGGIPTGAVVERGSNANGEYVRFADGTQICASLRTATTNPDFLSVVWTFPANFIEKPPVSSFSVNMTNLNWSAWADRSRFGATGAFAVSTTGGTFAAAKINGQFITVPATVSECSCLAIGRWY